MAAKAAPFPVVLVVVYHGIEPWRAPQGFAELVEAPEAFQAYVPAFFYRLYDLGAFGRLVCGLWRDNPIAATVMPSTPILSGCGGAGGKSRGPRGSVDRQVG